MRRFLNQILPFIFMGFAIVALVFGIMLLAYLFFFGALVGLVLYLFVVIRDKFFPPKPNIRKTQASRKGRVIDSDDWKKM